MFCIHKLTAPSSFPTGSLGEAIQLQTVEQVRTIALQIAENANDFESAKSAYSELSSALKYCEQKVVQKRFRCGFEHPQAFIRYLNLIQVLCPITNTAFMNLDAYRFKKLS